MTTMMAKPILVTAIAGLFLLAVAQGVLSQSGELDQAAQAVVRIRACDASGCDRGVGSGVIIEPSGVILTANHVTLTDPDDPLSDPLNDFVIEMTTDWRTVPAARYRAGLAAADRTNDLALLQIYWDEIEQDDIEFTDLDLLALPLDGPGAVDLGEQLHFLGYPLLGGATINYLDLGLSGYDGEERTLLKVPGALSPGYSGGPALIERDDGFHVIGVVIHQRFARGNDGANGQLSLIRSVDALPGLDWTPTARRAWVDDVTVTQPGEGDDPFVIEFDLQAIDFAARPGRAMAYAYAYDAANGEPWTSQRSDLPTTATGQVVLSSDFQVFGFLGKRHITLRAPGDAFVDLPDELAFRVVLWDTTAARAVWRDTQWRRPQAASATSAEPAAWQWPVPLLATTAATVQPASVSTATPLPTATPSPTSTPTSTPLVSPPPAPISAAELLSAAFTCHVLVRALRLRSGPGTVFAAKGMLNIEDVAAVARDPDAAWIEVRTQSGLRGWIYNLPTYLACEGAVADLPIGDQSSLPSPTPIRLLPVTTGPATTGPTAVELLTPADDTNSRDPLTFSWWPDAELAQGQVYELVFWEPSKGQDHERGGGAWQDAGTATTVTLDPAKHAPETYAWGIWLGAFDAGGRYERIRYLGGGWTFTVPSSSREEKRTGLQVFYTEDATRSGVLGLSSFGLRPEI